MNPTHDIARDLAVSALRDRAGNVSARLKHLLEEGPISPPDRAFARELALGSVRRRRTLQAILAAFLAEPHRRLPSPITEILHTAIYQLVFLDRVPAFAVVDEAVKQAGRFNHKRKCGMVNGVLRAVARNVSEMIPEPVPLAADAVPIRPDAHRKLTKAVFPSPDAEPAKYLAAAFSLPEELAARWLERMGSLQAAAEPAMHAGVRAPLIVRVNSLKASPAEVLEKLTAAGVAAALHVNGISLVLAKQHDVTQLDVFRDGLIQPQDATASAVAMTAAPQPGAKVLDFCAAPGTKTTHMAELMGDRGSIVAVDVSGEKLDLIGSNCRRLGITIVRTELAERVDQLPKAGFDLVLADVPCSNTGVLSRRAEARWRFSAEALAALAERQAVLAAAAAGFVKPGGRLVYSTCSIEPDECSRIVDALVKASPNLRLVEEKLTPPGGAAEPTAWHDGGYCAVLQAE